jgi:hypothetical protein
MADPMMEGDDFLNVIITLGRGILLPQEKN